MCISTLKEKHPHLNVAKEIVRNLQDSSITYLIHDNSVNDTLYSRYYILDLDEDQDQTNIYSYVENMDKFNVLQNAILANDYFECSDDMRFNLYFIILTANYSRIKNLREILCDYNYGRKLVLNEEFADVYFDSFDCSNTIRDYDKLRRMNNSEFVNKMASVEKSVIMKTIELSIDSYNKNKIFSEQLESLREKRSVINNLFNRGIKNKYLPNDIYLKTKYNADLYYGYLLHEASHLKNIREAPNTSKKIKLQRKNEHFINNNSVLNSIEKMVIKGHKNFPKYYEFSFSRVNLLYGDNGSGKTTIINGIKSTLTGLFEKSTIDNEGTICINGLAKDGDTMTFCSSNTEYQKYAQLWYNVSKEDLPKYFDKYNYFDGGRALDFALNDLDIADLFIDNSVNRAIKDLYSNKLFFSNQVEVILKSFENDISIANLPKPTEAKKTLEANDIELAETGNGIYNIILKKQFKNYNKGLQKAINSIRYENLKNLQKNIQCDLKNSQYQGISNSIIDELGIYKKIQSIFMLLTSARDYFGFQIDDNNSLRALKANSNIPILPADMSTGQRVCLALATLIAAFLENSKAPNIIILDEPVANLDDLHLLNMFDIVRQLSINGTQIFFTTANENVAKLFKRKFGFMKDNLKSMKICDIGDKVIINDF